jgi:hypothetical protein
MTYDIRYLLLSFRLETSAWFQRLILGVLLSASLLQPAMAQSNAKKTLMLDIPTWHKSKIPGAKGEIVYAENQQGAFTGDIKLSGLSAGQNYVIALNGKSGVAGNSLLPLTSNDENKSKYYDSQSIAADEKGNINQSFKVNLPAGIYEVKIFVKAVKDKYQIVLHNDSMEFRIR